MSKVFTSGFLLFPPGLHLESGTCVVIRVVSDKSNFASANVPCSGDKLKLKVMMLNELEKMNRRYLQVCGTASSYI